MKTAIVSGVIANKLGNGGATWTRLSWAVGLMRLGYRVIFIEQIDPQNCVDENGSRCEFARSANLRYFQNTTQSHGLAGHASLICGDGPEVDGLSLSQLEQAISKADFLINISGHLSIKSLLERASRRVYVDLDPGYTQHWHAQGNLPHLLNHNSFFTVGLNIGQDSCRIPTSSIDWQPTLQPVVLSDWPTLPIGDCQRFTTIASWRGPFGTIEENGIRLGPKAHEFRKYLELPRQLSADGIEMEIALDIDPSDLRDRQALVDGGWSIANPRTVAGTPDTFRSYVQQSSAEFSVAQGIYVQTQSGWFSDRTVRYLASGKPAVVQETGFSSHLPVGHGLLTFATPQQAIEELKRVKTHYADHCRSARAMAEEHFDSGRVLRKLIDRI
jgi:hypothetical protein